MGADDVSAFNTQINNGYEIERTQNVAQKTEVRKHDNFIQTDLTPQSPSLRDKKFKVDSKKGFSLKKLLSGFFSSRKVQDEVAVLGKIYKELQSDISIERRKSLELVLEIHHLDSQYVQDLEVLLKKPGNMTQQMEDLKSRYIYNLQNLKKDVHFTKLEKEYATVLESRLEKL